MARVKKVHVKMSILLVHIYKIKAFVKIKRTDISNTLNFLVY